MQKQIHNRSSRGQPLQNTICRQKPINFKLNKHRNDVFRDDSIPVWQHFNQASHDFTKHAEITIIEQVKHQNKGLAAMRATLEEREDFWIKKIKTLQPDGFNQELNRNE